MLIGELSRRTGVNPHQLRYYEAQGLLVPDRGDNGYREYGDDAVLTVAQISKLLDAGLLDPGDRVSPTVRQRCGPRSDALSGDPVEILLRAAHRRDWTSRSSRSSSPARRSGSTSRPRSSGSRRLEHGP
ncbi:hypothetical protein SVIOM74S_05222 [Streptomyces violarus]